MDSSDDDGGGANNHLIKMKTCPRCSTPIRKSLRYGNVIKQRLEDIAKVKIAAHGNPQEISGTQGRLLARLTELRRFDVNDDLAKDLERLERSVNRLAKGTMAAVTENQVTLIERYCAMNERINQHLCDLQKVALKWHNKQHLNLKGSYYFFSSLCEYTHRLASLLTEKQSGDARNALGIPSKVSSVLLNGRLFRRLKFSVYILLTFYSLKNIATIGRKSLVHYISEKF